MNMSKVLNFSNHPDFEAVNRVCRVLNDNNFLAYLAGGCVRDGILGVQPRDFDIATNALPEQVEALFPKTKPIGKAFGVILVIDGNAEIEVTTFRTEGGYQDGRHPKSVQFVESDNPAKEDAIRRDFTINAMFYDLETSQIIDFVGGEQDLQNKIIRAVGDPIRRFSEDHLRILRAIRFVGQLGFSLEEGTYAAVAQLASTVAKVSGERIHSELSKLLDSHYVNKSIEVLTKTEILKNLFSVEPKDIHPDFTITRDLQQRWGLFFLWLFIESDMAIVKIFFAKYRFSNAEQSTMNKILFWFQYPRAFEEKSFGELIEMSFDTHSYFGMSEFVKSTKYNKLSSRLNKIKERHDYFKGVKPKPLISAEQLRDQGLSGQNLGNKFKELFWKQLEG
jgi:tRNA nucleotidyltransferase/poly(A) polymerase